MDQFNILLATRGLRSTSARREVFGVLLKADQPLSVSNIVKQTKTADRTSVYRTIQLFSDIGIASIVPLGWKLRYELAGTFKPHHHHLQCTSCGKLVDINTPKLETLIESIARTQKFSLSSHHIELAGLCSDCHKS